GAADRVGEHGVVGFGSGGLGTGAWTGREQEPVPTRRPDVVPAGHLAPAALVERHAVKKHAGRLDPAVRGAHPGAGGAAAAGLGPAARPGRAEQVDLHTVHHTLRSSDPAGASNAARPAARRRASTPRPAAAAPPDPRND